MYQTRLWRWIYTKKKKKTVIEENEELQCLKVINIEIRAEVVIE